jgi:hypothetical protein
MHSSVKKLWLKYEYHTLELEETQGEFKKRKAEFEFAFRKKYDKLPVLQKSFIDSMLTEQNAGTAVIPPSTQEKREGNTHSLFKEVAKHTHPDKHAMRDEQTRLEKAIVFKRAKNLAEKGDWLGLYKIAQELGIEVEPPGEEERQKIEKTIEGMHRKVQEMLKTSAWKWYDLGSDNRVKYMEAYYTEVFKLHEEAHT